MAVRKRNSSLSTQVRKRVNKEVEGEKRITPEMCVPTGSTLLNLALSDMPNGGVLLGKMSNTIGDKHAGKTYMFYNMCAEACRCEHLEEHELVHDDVEQGCVFDVRAMFGRAAAERIVAPRTAANGEAVPSQTISDFHRNIMNRVESGRPFIYGLDSFDVLSSDEELAVLRKKRSIKKKGEEEKSKGSYGTDKVRGLGAMFREITQALEANNSHLMIISQVRANMGGGMFEPKFKRNGGYALGHAVSHEIWLFRGSAIKKKNRLVGHTVRPKITKNRSTGKMRSVEIPLYNGYGLDDIGSCVDFLVTEGTWKKRGNTINAVQFHIAGTRDKVIREIERKDLELKLQRLTGKVWMEIEASLVMKRKRRYE